MISILLVLLLQTFADLPSAATVGALNPAVTQATIMTTICVAGWTKTVRPPVSFTSKLKRQQMKALGLIGSPSLYEEDHLISLELGGAPTDPANMWPQPWAGEWNAHKKDRLENLLHKRVCEGSMTLDDAQAALSTDWTAAYRQYVKP